MFEWLPPDVEFSEDLAAADWLSTLEPWGSDGVRLASFMPSGFEAYARVFHPTEARGPTGASLSWAELGSKRGVALSPEVWFGDISGLDYLDGEFLSLAPEPGSLPPATCSTLLALLTPRTRTPETCWFCIWEGKGLLGGPGFPLVLGGPTRRELRRQRKEANAFNRQLDRLVKVSIPGRSYLLFRGPLDAACRFEPWGVYLSLNIWWPDDRAWIVATEVDGYTTYIGATRKAINDIVASSDLEAVEVPHDVRIS